MHDDVIRSLKESRRFESACLQTTFATTSTAAGTSLCLLATKMSSLQPSMYSLALPVAIKLARYSSLS